MVNLWLIDGYFMQNIWEPFWCPKFSLVGLVRIIDGLGCCPFATGNDDRWYTGIPNPAPLFSVKEFWGIIPKWP